MKSDFFVMPNFPEAFRQLLRDRVNRYGTVAEICRRTGLSRTAVDKWIAGETSPSLENVQATLDALEIDMWEFLNSSAGSNNKDPNRALREHIKRLIDKVPSQKLKYIQWTAESAIEEDAGK